MTEAETEAETLERLEAALLRIADLARPQHHPNSHEFDRAALIKSLDLMIARLRAGLNPPNGNLDNPE